ncbi:hypothetical protein GGI25_004212 [Coemansia spiralis]|uniref:Large ribosomal subunit protein bL31c n=2 Tax=Coemansia TaxID=4863 RepID=A0A9W8G0U4_9FUNG|nr:hypothetical protein EDC05_004191 [Coemansia umbellata]KAJ2624981.1 hypothetical protein GGI26_001093 [Coemansia sp. RSA 1358]KAJ2674825.1 hypothetical protein GGI25_004212 [Coemansia spiralis]
MRPTLQALKTVKSTLAREWKPRPLESNKPLISFPRHPERFTTQIVLSDGSSFRVRSTAPREQVKITKDTRSHPLWNPHVGQQIEDEGGYMSSFQKKFQGFDAVGFSFADDAEKAKAQKGTKDMMDKKKPKSTKK